MEKYAEQKEEKKHTVQLVARSDLTLTGVTDVKSFDEQTVELITDCGRLTVEGESLHVGVRDISGGVVRIEGQIGALFYSSEAPKGRGRRFGAR